MSFLLAIVPYMKLVCLDRFLTIPVESLVTGSTQTDQVFADVMPKLASRLDMMNLQVFRCAAILAAPIVSSENLLAESLVVLWM